jgi:hypothetical protein
MIAALAALGIVALLLWWARRERAMDAKPMDLTTGATNGHFNMCDGTGMNWDFKKLTGREAK